MVKTDIALPYNYSESDILGAICAALPVDRGEISEPRLLRRTLALDGSAPYYKCTVAFSASPERERGLLKMRKQVFGYTYPAWTPVSCRLDFRPVVVGAGPAGLFATLALAEAGCRPILLERGEAIEQRSLDVLAFRLGGRLNPESNIQFGEGGAGSYSDGKLKVGSMDKYKMKVLTELISAGAAEDILYSSTAHLGTDTLARIVPKIRERLLALGAEIHFSARLTDLVIKDGTLTSVVYERGGERISLDTRAVILATGHSARDTVQMLANKGLPAVAKGFGIGMRIEHPREYINRLIYKSHAEVIAETASYHLVTHLPTGRSVYSFCMCPGGSVVAATSEELGVVTNGMSDSDRMGENSNAAILVSLTPEDFGSDPLSGIALQRELEGRAYRVAGGYTAPSLSLDSLLSGGTPRLSHEVNPTYPRGVVPANPRDFLPDYITESLRAAFSDFDEWLPGYSYGAALLTGTETRTTSPIRFLRSEVSHEAVGFTGIYPSGEGAGYAGGIISSATDGLRTAECLMRAYSGEG